MQVTTIASLVAWKETFGFCEFLYQEQNKQAFIHASVLGLSKPVVGTKIRASIDLDAKPRPRVVSCSVLSEEAQKTAAILEAASSNAPIILMGWRLGDRPGQILVDQRQAEKFRTLEWAIAEARERGCPADVLAEAQSWVDILFQLESPVYRSDESSTKKGQVRVIIPELGVGWDKDKSKYSFPEHALIKRLNPSVGYHWYKTGGLDFAWGHPENCLIVTIASDTYEEFVLTALEEQWHPYAWGYWGGSDRADWRFLDDPQLCGYLGVHNEQLPDLRPAHSRSRPSIDEVVQRKRWAATERIQRPSTYRPQLSHLETVIHLDLLRDLYGKEQTTRAVTIRRQQLKVAVHTGLEEPRVNETPLGFTLFMPLNWGFVEFAGRDLGVEIYAADPDVVICEGNYGKVGASACGRVVLYGPFGSSARIMLKWWDKNGKWSKRLDTIVELRFDKDGVKTTIL